jgi:hypothetical protein
MDNVQKHSNYINIPSSQTFRPYLYVNLIRKGSPVDALWLGGCAMWLGGCLVWLGGSAMPPGALMRSELSSRGGHDEGHYYLLKCDAV